MELLYPKVTATSASDNVNTKVWSTDVVDTEALETSSFPAIRPPWHRRGEPQVDTSNVNTKVWITDAVGTDTVNTKVWSKDGEHKERESEVKVKPGRA